MMRATTPTPRSSKVETNRRRFLAGEPFRFENGNDLFKNEGSYISKNNYRDRSDFMFYCLLDVVAGIYFNYTFLIFGVKSTTDSIYFQDMIFEEGGEVS